MAMIQVPDELLAALGGSGLGGRKPEEQVRLALAMYLFREGHLSAARAAKLAGESRATFELLLADLGIPVVYLDVEEYEREVHDLARARERAGAP